MHGILMFCSTKGILLPRLPRISGKWGVTSRGSWNIQKQSFSANAITNDDHTGVNRLNHPSYKDKIMNHSIGLVDEIIMNDESSRIENPRTITNNPLYR
jgi:hypothetical protein